MKHFLHLKRLSALLLGLTVTIASNAAPITRQQAKERAAQFLQNVPGSRQLAPVTRRAKLSPRLKTATSVEKELYYVFNRGVNQGYVIVSGDDETLPVLGYTDEGEFDYEALPDNMRVWLSQYENELSEMREHPEKFPERPRYAPVHPAISPMITSKWSQGSPYNDLCPNYFNKGRSVTGCVATAMAQVLYYWRKISVTETQAAIPAYDTYTEDPTYGHLHVDGIAAGAPIDWDNMIDEYGSSATGKQRTAVAQLMLYCGVSVQMDYTNSSSGANSWRVADAMRNYFGYDNNTRYVDGSQYSADAWDALLYNELAEGRPFYLAGANAEGGHAFVCHGYDGNHCFRINWGWGGSSDGWFLLTTLNPSSQGIGGSSGGYSDYPEAILGSQPPASANKAMAFENKNAQKLCTAAFDADGDGTLTYAEAAAVKDLGTTFKGQRISALPELYYFTGLTAIADSAFAGCSNLASVNLPKKLRSIGAAAFEGCRSLKEINLPSTVTSIGANAFADCAKLTDVNLPERLQTIGDGAFLGCAALTSMTFPITLTNIGSQAFAGCSKLKTFTTKGLVPEILTIDATAFEGLDLSDATLNCQQGTTAYYSSTAPWNAIGTFKGERNFSGARFTEMAENTPVYIYNVGTGRFLSKGEAYGTQAVGTDAGMPMMFKLQRPSSGSSNYYLYSDDTGNNNHLTFRTKTDGKVGNGTWACFVDGTTSNGTSAQWTVTATEDGSYIIQTPKGATGYSANKALGINPDHASNETSPTYGAYPDVNKEQMPLNCRWRFVAQDAHADSVYVAAKALADLLELASMKHVSATRERAVYDNMDSDVAELERAQRTLRKRLGFIVFADEAARQACVGEWDVNQDGELTLAEAEAAEYFYNECGFQNNKKVTEFDEMLLFKNATAIFYNSFLGCSNLKRVLMPNRIASVASQAFKDCTSLANVEFGTGLLSIAENAFAGCTALKEVRLPVADPATVSVTANSFSGVDLSKAVLYVPQGSSALYAEADVWKEFGEIREMRVIPDAGFAPLEENETVYVYNLGTRSYLNKGEAYGTQAVVANSGVRYQVKRTKSMKEGQYYLQTLAAEKNTLFRTNSDPEVGKGVKACFVDGSVSAKAYWQVTEIDPERHIYTLQVPTGDSEHVDTLFLGTQYNHETDYTYITDGVYYDVDYNLNPANCQWAFIRLSDVEEVERQRDNMANLRSLLAIANGQALEVSTEQAVYDNPSSTDDDVQAAIDALRVKLHYIEFADERAKTICVNNWDANDDEELSVEEAAAVTDLGSAFRSATGVVSLEDLRYFTSLTSIPDEAFSSATTLQTIYLPAGVKTLGKNVFPTTSVLKYIVVLNNEAKLESETVGAEHHTWFVPQQFVEAYGADEAWAQSRVTAFTGQPIVTPDSVSRAYGRPNPTFTFHVDGAPISGQPEMSSEAVNASPVGFYPIAIEIGTITTEGVELRPGVLAVEPSLLTVTAKSYTREVGQENPEFELTIRTFRNRENASVFTAQPIIECDATKDSPAGEYEIRVYGAEAENYIFEYVFGTLTVTNPDGIAGIQADSKGGDVYDLSGRKMVNGQCSMFNGQCSMVNGKLPKGVYVIGGRKVVVK